MQDLLLRGATVVSFEGRRLADVQVRNGKIASVSDGGLSAIGCEVLDVDGLYLLPGVIDAHVHFRDPGMTQKEDFHSGSKAAAKGGVTTVFDMPNTNPPVYTIEVLEEKRRIAVEKSLVNFGFYFGAIGTNVEECEKAKNVAGIKVVMNETTAGATMSDPEVLRRIFGVEGKRFVLHAEGETFDEALSYLVSPDPSVPLSRETSPLGRNVGIHLAHVSLRREVERVRELKRQGINVTCEVTPHHLFLSEGNREIQGVFAVMKPPLATLDDQDALWEGLLDGTIDMIASDHAPHTKEEKLSSDVGLTYGVPGVENSLCLMLDAVNKGRLPLEQLVRLMCECPADVFGLRSKGRIEEGMDADLVLVDLHDMWVLSNGDQVTKCGWTPFHDWRITGLPVMTIVGGHIAYEDGFFHEEVRGREVEFTI